MRKVSQVSQKTVGWDVGGANLKAVLIDADGTVLDAIQLACPLWRGLTFLEQATQGILNRWDTHRFFSVVTMTGELVDLFADRSQGVQAIADCMQKMLGQGLAFYAVDDSDKKGRFVTDASQHPLSLASMNWHASVTYLAECVDECVVIDIGSTTTDILPVHLGKPVLTGVTDAARMQGHQLLYTGVVRTPLMAFGPYLQVSGCTYHLAAEYFATTADVYRLLGLLPSAYDLADTADGQDKGLTATARRLARMIGHDLEMGNQSHQWVSDSQELQNWKTLEDWKALEAWKALANGFKQQQLQWILEAVQHNIHPLPTDTPIIGLGAGQFLIQALAQLSQRPYVQAQQFIKAWTPESADNAACCFPAYAVARLWQIWQ